MKGSELQVTFEEAQQLLSKFVLPSEGWYQHSMAVAQVALAIAEALQESGHAIDINFVHTAALLHDIGRYKTHHPSLHGWEGYCLLNELAFPELARVCLTHVLKGRTMWEAIQEGVFPRELGSARTSEDFEVMGLEEKIVALADVMVLDTKIVNIEERYCRSWQKYPMSGWLSENERRVKIFRDEIEALLGDSVRELIADHGVD